MSCGVYVKHLQYLETSTLKHSKIRHCIIGSVAVVIMCTVLKEFVYG